MMRSLMRRRWIIPAVLLAALAVGVSTSFGAATRGLANGLQQLFGPNMARAEIILVQNGQVLDYRLDQGRIVTAQNGTIMVRERDGTLQSVTVAPNATIEVNGSPGTFAQLTPRMIALVVRIGDAPATLVRAHGFGR
jgi:hypothetical protein